MYPRLLTSTLYRTLSLLVLASVLATGCEQVSLTITEVILLNSFDTNDMGWTISEGGVKGYSATGGNPDGYVYGDDTGGPAWYFVAPNYVVSESRKSYNKILSFDLEQEVTSSLYVDVGGDVILTGNKIRLTYKFTKPPTITWTRYTILLNESSGWQKGSSAATKEDMQQVLQNLTDLRIRGDFTPGPIRGGLDNVSIR